MPNVARIAEQLRATKALFGYAYSAAVPKLENWLTDVLAQRIAAYGFEDIREIGYGPQGFFNRTTGEPITRGAHLYDYSSSYDHDSYTGDVQLWEWVTPDLFDVAYNSDWFAQYYARFTDDGVPYFVVVLKPQVDWKQTLAEALSMAFAAASFFVPGVNVVIGQMIFSKATIAAYPALTSIATGTMVQTVLNGGNVEKAVQMALASYVGGSVGNFVKGVSDSQALGALANTAAKTALTGGDMEKALVSTVLRIAPDAVAELSAGESPAGPALSPVADPVKVTIDQPGAMMDDYQSVVFDAGAFGAGAALDDQSFALAPPSLTFDTSDLSLLSIDPMIAETTLPSFDLSPGFDLSQALPESWAALPTDLPPYEYTVPTGGPMIEPPQFSVIVEPPNSAAPAASPFDFNSAIKSITFAAQSALGLVTAWKAAKYGGINASARVVNPNGSQTVVSDSGMVMTRDQSGRVSQTKPAPGEARLTTSGNIVVNNGDGTYTLISQSGERRVIAYPGTQSGNVYVPSAGGGLSSLLGNINATHVGIGVGLLGLLFAMRRKR